MGSRSLEDYPASISIKTFIVCLVAFTCLTGTVAWADCSLVHASVLPEPPSQRDSFSDHQLLPNGKVVLKRERANDSSLDIVLVTPLDGTRASVETLFHQEQSSSSPRIKELEAAHLDLNTEILSIVFRAEDKRTVNGRELHKIQYNLLTVDSDGVPSGPFKILEREFNETDLYGRLTNGSVQVSEDGIVSVAYSFALTNLSNNLSHGAGEVLSCSLLDVPGVPRCGVHSPQAVLTSMSGGGEQSASVDVLKSFSFLEQGQLKTIAALAIRDDNNRFANLVVEFHGSTPISILREESDTLLHADSRAILYTEQGGMVALYNRDGSRIQSMVPNPSLTPRVTRVSASQAPNGDRILSYVRFDPELRRFSAYAAGFNHTSRGLSFNGELSAYLNTDEVQAAGTLVSSLNRNLTAGSMTQALTLATCQ